MYSDYAGYVPLLCSVEGGISRIVPDLMDVDEIEAGDAVIEEASQVSRVGCPESGGGPSVEYVSWDSLRSGDVGADPMAHGSGYLAVYSFVVQGRYELGDDDYRASPGGGHARGDVEDVHIAPGPSYVDPVLCGVSGLVAALRIRRATDCGRDDNFGESRW